jgi:hypothetical protein
MGRFSAIRIPGTSKGLNTTPGGAIRAAALATTVLGLRRLAGRPT